MAATLSGARHLKARGLIARVPLRRPREMQGVAGASLARYLETGSKSSPSKMKLRRVLAFVADSEVIIDAFWALACRRGHRTDCAAIEDSIVVGSCDAARPALILAVVLSGRLRGQHAEGPVLRATGLHFTAPR